MSSKKYFYVLLRIYFVLFQHTQIKLTRDNNYWVIIVINNPTETIKSMHFYTIQYRDDSSFAILFIRYMDISIMSPSAFRINFHRKTMIGANFARRCFNYLNGRFLKADGGEDEGRDLAIAAKFSLTSYFLCRCKLISSLLSTFILYFQISGQSFSTIGILRYIYRDLCYWRNRTSSEGDDKAYLQVLSCFLPSYLWTSFSDCLFADESNESRDKKNICEK